MTPETKQKRKKRERGGGLNKEPWTFTRVAKPTLLFQSKLNIFKTVYKCS